VNQSKLKDKYMSLTQSAGKQARAVVLLLLFQHVSASCLGVFLFDFVHQLSSTASLSLSELSSTAKFFKISLVQSNFPSVGSL